MRPKFVITLMLFTFLVVGAALLWKQTHQDGKHKSAVAPEAVVDVSSGEKPAEKNVAKIASPTPQPDPVIATAASPPPIAPLPKEAMTPEQTQEAVDAEVEHLQDLSMKDDAASLATILVALTNSNNEIREAAIDAAQQFGDPSAIPALKAAANATDNLQEKIAYLEAADFLTIPPVEFNGPTKSPTPEQVQKRMQQRTARLAQQQAVEQQPEGQNP